jgi:hypothetical protein
LEWAVSKPGKCFIILNQVASNGLMVRLTFEKELKDATKKKLSWYNLRLL